MSELQMIGHLDIKGHDAIKRVYHPDGIAPTLTTSGGYREVKIFDTSKYRVRKLTPTEYGRLQAFPMERWEQVVSDSQAYKQFGNAVTVNVVAAIAEQLKGCLEQNGEVIQMDDKKKLQEVIALDFDGCLCENKYPEIGEPNRAVIREAIRRKTAGAALVLWTCREGELLTAALDACESWGIKLDAVNENLQSWQEAWNNDTRKIGATEYWDDRAVIMPESALDAYGQEVCAAAVNTFGNEVQILVAAEELAELQKELLKLVRWEHTKQGDLCAIMDHIAEERADVEIMLRQLEIIFGSCDSWKEKKLVCLEDTINKKCSLRL